MARQIKPYEDKLKDILQKANLYHERNDSMIHDVAILEMIRDNYFDSIKQNPPLIREIGSQRQTKFKLNPIYEQLTKVLSRIIMGKAKLGLGNTSKIQEQAETDLDKFIRELES